MQTQVQMMAIDKVEQKKYKLYMEDMLKQSKRKPITKKLSICEDKSIKNYVDYEMCLQNDKIKEILIQDLKSLQLPEHNYIDVFLECRLQELKSLKNLRNQIPTNQYDDWVLVDQTDE